MPKAKSKSSNIHDGHRDRLRTRLIASGIDDSIPDHEIIEYLLTLTIPRHDTNDIAHRLVNTFGSFAGVLDADIDDLIKRGKVTPNTAVMFKMLMPIARAYTARSTKGKTNLSEIKDIAPYVHSLYAGYEKEVISILLLSESGQVIRMETLAHGDVNSANVSIKAVADKALRSGATAVALVHNHPNGLALPSMEDLTVTKEVRLALSHLGIKLVDHVIIANDSYLSLACSERFSKVF